MRTFILTRENLTIRQKSLLVQMAIGCQNDACKEVHSLKCDQKPSETFVMYQKISRNLSFVKTGNVIFYDQMLSICIQFLGKCISSSYLQTYGMKAVTIKTMKNRDNMYLMLFQEHLPWKRILQTGQPVQRKTVWSASNTHTRLG